MTEPGRRPFRKYLLGGLICLVALVTLWLRIRLGSGQLIDSKLSPDGKYVAS
jgi:hypothetical protein